METEPNQPQRAPHHEKLTTIEHLASTMSSIGVAMGLALLWGLETIRNVAFRTLDRLNVKARPRRVGSAFPPGSPRRRRKAA